MTCIRCTALPTLACHMAVASHKRISDGRFRMIHALSFSPLALSRRSRACASTRRPSHVHSNSVQQTVSSLLTCTAAGRVLPHVQPPALRVAGRLPAARAAPLAPGRDVPAGGLVAAWGWGRMLLLSHAEGILARTMQVLETPRCAHLLMLCTRASVAAV